MSDHKISENNSNKHDALERLWPSDAKESKKLAELKQQKHQNLVDLGVQFKTTREALGYNISELNDHTGLSFSELEAMEQGNFTQIEQQDYVDYYVHTYAALLGLDADELLNQFKQNFYDDVPVASKSSVSLIDTDQDPIEVGDSQLQTQPEISTVIDEGDFIEYDPAFADEVKQTQAAIENSNVQTSDIIPQRITNQNQPNFTPSSNPSSNTQSIDPELAQETNSLIH